LKFLENFTGQSKKKRLG